MSSYIPLKLIHHKKTGKYKIRPPPGAYLGGGGTLGHCPPLGAEGALLPLPPPGIEKLVSGTAP